MRMDEVSESLKQRYSHLHPLIFLRSVERAKNVSNLFDILEGIPKKYPIEWAEDKWQYVNS